MRLFNILSLVFLSIMASCAFTPAMAKVTYFEGSKTAIIDGRTTEYQAVSVYNLFRKNEVETVYMRGPGGDLIAGLKIGKLVLEEGATVVVRKDTYCISACAFAAIASKDTRVYGQLWLHRPYVPGYPTFMRLDDLNGMALEVSATISKYFVHIGYPIEVWRTLASKTNPCYFVVIYSKEVLDNLRGQPLDNRVVPSTYLDKCGGTPFKEN